MTSELPLAGYPAIQDYLFSLKTAGVKFGVDRMRLLSAEIARTHYGVAITDGVVDAAATERLRTERRAS